MKKAISIALAFVMVLSCAFAFAGCAKKSNTYDLVLITDGSTITDKGYNQSAWNGVKSFGDENDMTYRYYQPNLEDDGTLSLETVKNYIDLAVNDGAKYVVLPGEDFAVAAYEYAPTYSDVNFVLVDAYPHSQDDTSARFQENVMCVTFDELQEGFLAGYSSVIDGYTKLGYLGSVNSSTSGDYGAGYVQGAAYAADELGIPVTLDYADYDSPLLNYDYSVTIKAVYQKRELSNEETYKVTVVDGIGSGVYTDGENVTITANSAPEGKVFDHWEVKSDTEGVKDKKVNISSKKKSSMNLLVGDCDCTITAVWADANTVPVTVTQADGTTVYETINAVENTSASITAPAAESGMVFDHWESSDISAIADVNSSTTSINVTTEAISVVPVYVESENPTFTVTVENGSGSGSYVAGDQINIVADAPEDGYMFYKWENIDNQGLSTGIAMTNEYCYTTDFEMVDRFASIVEKMYDDGDEVVFGGGNPLSDSIFSATWNFDYQVYAFGYGIDESSKGNCLASVVSDYGSAIKLALADFKGGTIFVGDCSNECVYVTGKSINATYTDSNGNEKDDESYNEAYAKVYAGLADDSIKTTNVQSGGDVRRSYTSKCLTLNYWITEN
jgi:hypothetical protein